MARRWSSRPPWPPSTTMRSGPWRRGDRERQLEVGGVLGLRVALDRGPAARRPGPARPRRPSRSRRRRGRRGARAPGPGRRRSRRPPPARRPGRSGSCPPSSASPPVTTTIVLAAARVPSVPIPSAGITRIRFLGRWRPLGSATLSARLPRAPLRAGGQRTSAGSYRRRRAAHPLRRRARAVPRVRPRLHRRRDRAPPRGVGARRDRRPRSLFTKAGAHGFLGHGRARGATAAAASTTSGTTS